MKDWAVKRCSILISVLVVSGLAVESQALEVAVSPEQPSSLDIVTAHVQGQHPSSGYSLDRTVLTRIGTTLTLDIYWHLSEGMHLTVMAPYTYEESLGTFLPGEYVLEVRSFYEYSVGSATAWFVVTGSLDTGGATPESSHLIDLSPRQDRWTFHDAGYEMYLWSPRNSLYFGELSPLEGLLLDEGLWPGSWGGLMYSFPLQ